MHESFERVARGEILPEPCYITLCRRQRSLQLRWRPLRSRRTPLHVVIDSSGLKVYGEGE